MTAIRSKVSRGTLEKESLLQAKSEKVEMTLNTDSAVASGLLIQRLTELYEDPVEASVRETVSNALDAVMESHSGDNPEIKIVAPSSLNPVFTVRDNGIGMSYDDLKEIYSKYGASTKADNFEQIGAYGLGAKAPLAYGTEFTVTSVKDGVRTTIIVAREELTNYIKIVDSSKVDAPSGTTVSIPVSNHDIERFNNHIETYKKNPIDKDGVKVFINNEEVIESEYVEVTDNMLIFNSKDGEVRARLWVKKSKDTVVNIISSMDERQIRRSLNYLIGGWGYKNPTTRGGYYGTSSGIMVELKAGIVAFNSSRDAILENDRYNKLEDLVVDYVQSDKFVKDLTKSVNRLDSDNFKSIVISLLNRNTRNLHIKDGKISVSATSYYGGSRNYSISDFVHEETGFKFDDIFTGVPTNPGKTAAVMEEKESYKKSVDNYIPSKIVENDSGEIEHATFKRTRVTEAIAMIDNVMYGETDSNSLESLVLNIALKAYSESKELMRVTFVTDVDAEGDEKSFKQAKTGRKAIVRMRNQDKQDSRYISYLIYTSHDKKTVENLVDKAGFNDLDIEVETIDDMLGKLKEFRKSTRVTKSKKSPSQKLSTSITKYRNDDNPERISTSDIDTEVDDSKTNVFIVTKENYLGSSELRMIKAWYCNEHKASENDVEIYVSRGQHRKPDLEALRTLGELYEDPNSRYAGHSKLYTELLEGRLAGMHTVNEKDKDVERKSFVRLLASLNGSSPSDTIDLTISKVNAAYDIAKITGFELPTLNSTEIEEVGVIGHNEFGSAYSSWRWRLDNEGMKQLIRNIDKDKYELIESLAPLYRNWKGIEITEDGEYEIYQSDSGITDTPELSDIERAYKVGNENSSYHKLVRAKTEAYLEFTKDVIEKLSTIKFK